MKHEERKIAEVDQYISQLPSDIQAITASLRKIILNTSPKIMEEFKWSMPNYSYQGLCCYLQASKKHVNLGFHKGNELEAQGHQDVLQGTGKTMRHIKINKVEQIDNELFTQLVHQAMKLNEK